MAIFSGLILSIKRSQFRANDRGAAAADAEYRTARPRALESQGWRCYACRLVSKLTNEIHHLGRHDDNRPEQLKCACWLCHAYGHVGQAAVGPGGSDSSVEALGRKTVMGGRMPVITMNMGRVSRASITVPTRSGAPRPGISGIWSWQRNRAV